MLLHVLLLFSNSELSKQYLMLTDRLLTLSQRTKKITSRGDSFHFNSVLRCYITKGFFFTVVPITKGGLHSFILKKTHEKINLETHIVCLCVYVHAEGGGGAFIFIYYFDFNFLFPYLFKTV